MKKGGRKVVFRGFFKNFHIQGLELKVSLDFLYDYASFHIILFNKNEFLVLKTQKNESPPTFVADCIYHISTN